VGRNWSTSCEAINRRHTRQIIQPLGLSRAYQIGSQVASLVTDSQSNTELNLTIYFDLFNALPRYYNLRSRVSFDLLHELVWTLLPGSRTGLQLNDEAAFADGAAHMACDRRHA
jgi:hypothetical protein